MVILTATRQKGTMRIRSITHWNIRQSAPVLPAYQFRFQSERKRETPVNRDEMMEFGPEREDKVGDYEYNRELNVKKARLNSTLDALLHDPILADVPNNPTLSDVDTLISLELGSAMRLSVLKLDGTSFGTCTSLSLSLSQLGILTSK
jgi:hypothetical protein